ncbi:MAG TPA: TIGR02206 family membrane protein [Xanthobacteraceae bacterium]|nr:TIGR02206 family membrane protein [Xanthobacteraceae bacterium]
MSTFFSSSFDVFVAFSALHLLAVAVCTLVIAGLALAGRTLRARGMETRLRRSWAVLALSYWFISAIARNWDGLDVDGGLPLHLCDFNGLAAPLALLMLNRWARATLYFWSFTLTLQAFIQPLLATGPAHLAFWSFWIGHTLIMASAVYDVAVLDFRPDWRDVGRVLTVSAAYIGLVLPIDLALGVDYGFIGNPPPGTIIPPFIDAMGAWPQRALIVMGLAVIGFVVALLPWRLVDEAMPIEKETLAAE